MKRRKAWLLWESVRNNPKSFRFTKTVPRLSGLLHDVCYFLGKDSCWGVFAIHHPVGLCGFPSFCDEYPEVRSHTRINDSDVWAHHGHLLDDRIINQDRGCLLLCRNDNTIRGCIIAVLEGNASCTPTYLWFRDWLYPARLRLRRVRSERVCHLEKKLSRSS